MTCPVSSLGSRTEKRSVVTAFVLPTMLGPLAPEPERPVGNLVGGRRIGCVQALIWRLMRHLLSAEIAVELAEQGIAVFLSPVGQVGDEVFDLLASGLAQCLDAAEIGRVRLDQGGVELMLANQLAEAVADFADRRGFRCHWRLRRKLLRLWEAELARRRNRSPRPSRCRFRRLCAELG